MIQRSGEVVIQMLKNVKELTIMPIITKTIEIGSEVFTDEYSIYQNLPETMVTVIKQCVIQKVSMQEMKMEMDFVKCIPTLWRDFGHY